MGEPKTILLTHSREKLLNAILFFAKNTRSCYKLKLFKLLFFLDFRVYRETGRSVTGLEYFAWKMGPVPRELYSELKNPQLDFLKLISVRPNRDTDPDFSEATLIISPRKQFDSSSFTERELKTMENLAEIFRDATANQMSEASHFPGQPWHRVYEVEKTTTSKDTLHSCIGFQARLHHKGTGRGDRTRGSRD
jgi:uncharacterized phage-associated protein